ncbi:MAG: shikimate dehydrogenase [Sphaerochaetaceae bacterium]
MSEKYKKLREEALMHGPLEALFCCIGDPVIGNPTQIMMEDAFEDLNFPARYFTSTVTGDRVKEAIEGIKALGLAGANVTAPHKVAVIPYLDGLTESARLSGAVNCIIRDGEKLIGDNTDGKGFLTSIELVKRVEGMEVLVLGSGGAARAIITELALHKAATITIANRTLSKAQEIVKALEKEVSTKLTAVELTNKFVIEEQWDLVVQATSVGLFAPADSLDLVWQKGKRIAADVVFNPIETQFLKAAKASGAHCIDGLGMLVYQGAIAIQQWSGQAANFEIMKRSLERAFSI